MNFVKGRGILAPSRAGAAAVVLGWFGSTQRRIRRHVELVSGTLGFDTLAVVPSMPSVAFPVVARATARRIRDEITSGHLRGKSKVVFLLLSGCGENVFSHVLVDSAKKNDSSLIRRIAGVAYDSAPVDPDPAVWSRAFTAAAFSKVPFRSSRTAVYDHAIVTPVARAFSTAHLRLPWNASWVRSAAVSADSCLPRSVPMLFLFSDSDTLVASSFIQAFADRQAERCRRSVTTRKFDSEHVDHLRAHPREYCASLNDWLIKVCDL